jgi:protoheme IX farnesyltransferase
MDRDIDKKMKRTQKRALAQELITGKSAIIFATVLGISGAAVLKLFTNNIALVVALAGLVIYVILYGFWKRRSTIGTLVGSISGAIPPVVGYCAVSGAFDLGALILFLILVFWQMPHFYSIAMYRHDDYSKAGIPALPVKKGFYVTKVHILFYIIGYIFFVACLNFYGYTGKTYLFVSVVLGCIWLGYGINGFNNQNDELWARKMFRVSLIVLTTTSIVIGLDSFLP